MRFAFIRTEKAHYPVSMLCRVMAVSRSGFYRWCVRKPARRREADALLKDRVLAVHRRSRATYGSPRVHADLKANGVRVGRKRVERVMRENQIQACRKRRFRRTTDSNHGQPVAENLLGRNFTAPAPNRVWVTDVTAYAFGDAILTVDAQSRTVCVQGGEAYEREDGFTG